MADVIKSIRRQSLNAPEGIMSVDDETQHTWRPVYIGKIRGDGQFDLVWSSEKPIRPIPYPSSRPQAEWDSFLENLNRTWGGWANPGPKMLARAGQRTGLGPVPTASTIGSIRTSAEVPAQTSRICTRRISTPLSSNSSGTNGHELAIGIRSDCPD